MPTQIAVATATTAPTATATLTPALPRPAWLDADCLHTIYALTQQESGILVDERLPEEQENRNVQGRQAVLFTAWQIVNEMRSRDACTTGGKWKLKRDMSISPIVAMEADRALLDPSLHFITCQFVGSLSDPDRWRAAGYKTRIDYGPFIVPSIGLGVVGVNCRS